MLGLYIFNSFISPLLLFDWISIEKANKKFGFYLSFMVLWYFMVLWCCFLVYFGEFGVLCSGSIENNQILWFFFLNSLVFARSWDFSRFSLHVVSWCHISLWANCLEGTVEVLHWFVFNEFFWGFYVEGFFLTGLWEHIKIYIMLSLFNYFFLHHIKGIWRTFNDPPLEPNHLFLKPFKFHSTFLLHTFVCQVKYKWWKDDGTGENADRSS